MRKIVALLLLIACGSGPVFAEVTAKDIAAFLKRNDVYAQDGFAARSEFYKALNDAPQDAKVAGAAALLAERWKISTKVAAELIDATLSAESAIGEDEASQRQQNRIEAEFRGAIAAEPQSAEAWSMAILFWANQGRCDDAQLRDEYFSKSFAESHYLRLFDCENWIPTFARLHPDNLEARFALARYLEDRDGAAALALNRWALDALPRTSNVPAEARLYAVRSYWTLLGASGLVQVLLDEIDKTSGESRDKLLHQEAKAAPEFGQYEMGGLLDAQNRQVGASRQWLAALIWSGRVDEARAELKAHPTKEDDDYLLDVLAGTGKGDLWDRYVGDGEAGWLWEIEREGDIAMRLAARFLAANRMPSAAEMLRDKLCHPYFDRNGWAQIEQELMRLPTAYQKYRQQHSEWIAAARREAGCAVTSTREATPMSSQLKRFPEVPLTQVERSRAAWPNYSGKIPLPASFELVRAEKSATEIRAVCISPAVDPGGEVTRGGYWLLRSADGGANWSSPVYLGFQDHNPYVVSPTARVSMFAPGVLRLEAEVAELDPDSIMFPPVALATRREARDLYIDIPLEAIERDTDGDGLTDLLEAKLATDPANVDTDGDGLSDRFDDFPQASARAAPNALAPIVVDVLRQLTGYERAGIIEPVRKQNEKDRAFLTGLRRADAGSMLFRFVEGDAKMFAGLRADGQVIVLDADQIAAIRARSGPFYPLSFPAILIDPQHTRALVKWSAGWTGGTISYHLENGRWKSTHGSDWITRAPRVTSTPRISPG